MSTAEGKNPSFSYTIKTQKTIKQAVEDITTSLKEVGFGILGTLNFKEILEKKGLDFKDEYQLLEVCNPEAAKQVLESYILRLDCCYRVLLQYIRITMRISLA